MIPPAGVLRRENTMRTANKVGQEITRSLCKERNRITFVGLAKSKSNLKAFRSYVNHLNPAGLRDIQSTVKGNCIYYTAKIDPKKKGRACHLIQVNARLNKMTIPEWIGSQGNLYRSKNNLPALINYPTSTRAEKKDTADIADVVKAGIKKGKSHRGMKHTQTVKVKRSLWNRLFGWLVVKDI